MHHGVGVLFTTHERDLFLLQQKDALYKSKPYGFSVFGGRIEDGEDALIAASRELSEELSSVAAELLTPDTSIIFCGVIKSKHSYHFSLFELPVDRTTFQVLTEIPVKEGRSSVVVDRATLLQLKMIWDLEFSMKAYFKGLGS